jgi:hypothetical protein
MRDHLALASQRKYDRNWALWVTFCQGNDIYMSGFSDLRKQLQLIKFLDHLVYEVKVTPSLLEASWAALKHHFLLRGPCDSFLETSYILRAWQISRRVVRRMNPSAARLATMPVSSEMAAASRVWSRSAGNLKASLIDLTFRIGFFFGNRISEIGITQGSSHPLYSGNVTFHTLQGASITASDSTITRLDVKSIDCISFYWPTSKTGCKTLYLVQKTPYGKELLADVLYWAKTVVSGREQPFLSYSINGRVYQVSRDAMNRYVKKLAGKFSLNPARYSTRSIRVGAASELSAMGESKSAIDRAIGWSARGTSSIRYIRPSPHVDATNPLAARDLYIMQTSNRS